MNTPSSVETDGLFQRETSNLVCLDLDARKRAGGQAAPPPQARVQQPPAMRKISRNRSGSFVCPSATINRMRALMPLR